jgi:glycosyltransferase involved in cell wall biosynthesis
MQIAILLATYNGASYLQEQLDSYTAQSYLDWTLWASDDGSTDCTIAIVKDFSRKIGSNRVHQVNGPKKGFAANFLSLVRNSDLKADAYAYSDQDDIWMDDKLERAAKFLASIPDDIPALYCSRTHYVDAQNRPLGFSQKYLRPAVFANALVQNIASGNTMVFNNAARSLLLKAGLGIDIDLHDWLTYILVSGAGGKVLFDLKPSVRYRQHANNLIGMNIGFMAKMMRIQALMKGRFSNWNRQHIDILNKVEGMLTPQNLAIYEKFSKARKLNGFARLVGLKRSGVYRQSLSNNIAFFFAVILGKV